jgi:hypothetical protein
VGKSAIICIGAIGIGAIIFAMKFLKPAGEQAEASRTVLTDAYKPRVVACRELEYDEIPESLPRPEVDEDLVYVAITVLYPGVDRVKEPKAHRLIGVNGEQVALDPVEMEYGEVDEGTELTLIFKASTSFEYARLVHGEETVSERVQLP